MAAAPAAVLSSVRSWSGEALVFRGATALALVHALDDAFLGRQPGIPVERHALAAAVALAVGLAAGVWFPRLRPGLRAGVALVFGVLAVVNGALHLAHVAVNEVSGSDVTGVLAVGAGAALLALGVAIPFRRRGERGGARARRWTRRFAAVAVGAVVLYVLVVPFGGAIVQTHKHREPVGAPPSAAYQPVTFRSSDGLQLSGWYVPSRNRAAVILVHGGGGDRTGAVRHAELLTRHGYGVLLYDSRGRGESEGTHNALGWGWEKDVEGARAFLRDRPDVDPGRIGGLGLSTGADVLIEVAAGNRGLAAVVSDGATVRSFADQRNVAGIDVTAPFFLSFTTAVRVLSGSSPGKPLKELVAEVSPTPLLLIAAGRGVVGERDANRVYAEAARQPFELWDLPHVRHTDAVAERAAEYERRVVGFLDDALLDGRP